MNPYRFAAADGRRIRRLITSGAPMSEQDHEAARAWAGDWLPRVNLPWLLAGAVTVGFVSLLMFASGTTFGRVFGGVCGIAALAQYWLFTVWRAIDRWYRQNS